MIEFTRPDGQKAPGYLATTHVHDAPGVVMLEEWWGLTDHIKHTADSLAVAGFRVLVPDMFRGRSAVVPDEASHMLDGLDYKDASEQDARGAAQYLKATGSHKVGVIGFCVGGTLAIMSAMHVPEFDAAISFYGIPGEDAGDPGTIKIPLQGHWGEHDKFYTMDKVNALAARLNEARVAHDFHVYDGDHGFHNPNQMGHAGLGHYKPDLARQAWTRSVEFFQHNLK